MRNLLGFLILVLVLSSLPGCAGGGSYLVVRNPHTDRIVAVPEVGGYYVYDVVPSSYRQSRIVVHGSRYHWSGRSYTRYVHRRGARRPAVHQRGHHGGRRPAVHQRGHHGGRRPAAHRPSSHRGQKKSPPSKKRRGKKKKKSRGRR